MSLSARLQDSAAAALFQAAPPAAQLGAAGVAVVGAAISKAFTGVFAAIVVSLFLCDLLLGVLKAINVGGLRAFSPEKFGRAFVQLGAAMVGILLAVSVDLLFQNMGAYEDAVYFTTGIMGAVCVKFIVSGGQSLAHFFPAVGPWIDALARRLRDPDELPQRRASDQVEAGP